MLSFPGAHSDPPFLHSGPGQSTQEVPEVTRKVASAICRFGQLTPQVPKKVRLVHMVFWLPGGAFHFLGSTEFVK